MDLTQFLANLRELSPISSWIIHNGSIRSFDMKVGDYYADPLTFIANTLAQDHRWTPARFLDAANYLKVPSQLACSISNATDNRGERWLRQEILDAVGLLPNRN